MKWFYRPGVGLVTFVIACASSGSSDVPDGGLDGGMEAELAIRAAVRLNEDCTDASDEVLTVGSWDLASGENYGVLLTVERTASQDSEALDRNVAVTTFEIALEALDGTRLTLDDFPNPYLTNANFVIPAGDTAGTGFCLGIPQTFAEVISDLGLDAIVLQIEANGVISSGVELFSEPFPLRVDLCGGCDATDCPPDPEPCLPGSNGDPWCRP